MVTYDGVKQLLTVSIGDYYVTIPDVQVYIADKIQIMSEDRAVGYAETLLSNRRVTKMLMEL